MIGTAASIVENVVIGGDASTLDRALASASSSLASFSKKLIGIGAAFAAIGIGVKIANDIADAVKGSAEEIDKLGKAAQSVGIPIEELSKLKYAADLSGTSLEGLSVAVGKLSKNMSEFAGGNEDAGKAFRALGISVTDTSGNLRSSSEVMIDVAGKFAAMEDGAGKTALAMALFGKSGKDLIPLLNSGAAGLREMYQEAEKFGLVISEKTFKAAEAFNDNLTRLGKIKDGLVIGITAQLLPALQTLSGALVTAAGKGDLVSTAAALVNQGIINGVTAVLTLTTAWERLTVTWAAAQALLNTPGSLFDPASWNVLGQRWEAFTAVLEGNKAAWANLPQRVQETIDGFNQAGAAALDLAAKTKAPVLASVDFQKSIDTMRVKTLELQQTFANVAPGFADQAIALKLLTPAQIAHAGAIALTKDQLVQLNAAMLAFKGAQITQENLLPWDTLAQKTNELNLLLASGAINAQTYQRALQAAADSAGLSFKMASTSIAGSFVEIANGIGGSSSQIAKIAQATAAAVALINSLLAESYALAGPFPANLVAVATVAAKSAALIAAIKGTKTPSFAMGGSFKVPGGISGVDNRLVQLNLAAGERVDVTPANRASGSSGSVLTVRGLRPNELFDGEAVRDLAEQLLAFQRDGGKVILS